MSQTLCVQTEGNSLCSVFLHWSHTTGLVYQKALIELHHTSLPINAAMHTTGETDEGHQELVQFCQDFPFQRMGAFTYSEEDGTPAADYLDQVSQKDLSRTRSWLEEGAGMSLLRSWYLLLY